MEEKRLVRKNGKIAGVCGGLASYFGLDATTLRIIWVILVLGAGTGILVYLIMWIVMPKEDARPTSQGPHTSNKEKES